MVLVFPQPQLLLFLFALRAHAQSKTFSNAPNATHGPIFRVSILNSVKFLIKLNPNERKTFDNILCYSRVSLLCGKCLDHTTPAESTHCSTKTEDVSLNPTDCSSSTQTEDEPTSYNDDSFLNHSSQDPVPIRNRNVDLSVIIDSDLASKNCSRLCLLWCPRSPLQLLSLPNELQRYRPQIHRGRLTTTPVPSK